MSFRSSRGSSSSSSGSSSASSTVPKSKSKSRSNVSSLSNDKCYTPLPIPLSSPYDDDPRRDLTPTEQELYDQVVAHFTRPGYCLPEWEDSLEEGAGGGGGGKAKDGAGEGQLSEKEKFWLSRDCLLRYLRASKWNTHVAAQKLESTLKWRREYGLYDTLTASAIEHEAVTGKHVYFGYDVEGRPAFYAFPSRQNTDSIDGHLKFAFWMVERGIELMGPGVETLHILLNFAERASKPSISEATSLIHIMQEHYPERLGLCSIINIPFFINAFLKLVLPFLDPRTRGKLRFNQRVVGEEEQEEGVGKEKKGKDKDKVSEKDKTKEGSGGGGLFKRDMLMKEWEGDRVFEYVHEKYWPALLEMCEKNVQKWMRRWRELGGTVGISEWDYKHEAGELGAGASTTASGKVSENGAANQISGNGSANQESANGSVNQQPSTNGHPIANGNHGDAATSDPPPKEAKPSASSPESKMTSDSLSSSTTLPTACPVVEAPKSN